MPRRSKGLMSKGRSVFRKHPRDRGQVSVARSVQDIPIGSKVTIIIDSGIQGGQPHRRYQGRVGTIYGRMGRAYMVALKDGGKIKKIISGAEHLRLVR